MAEFASTDRTARSRRPCRRCSERFPRWRATRWRHAGRHRPRRWNRRARRRARSDARECVPPWKTAARTGEQDERTQRRTDGLRRIARTLLTGQVARQYNRLADGDGHVEAPKRAAERQARVHRAARRLKHDNLAGDIARACECFELARAVWPDRAFGRHPFPARVATLVSGSFAHPPKLHAAGPFRGWVELGRVAAFLSAEVARANNQEDEYRGEAKAGCKSGPRERRRWIGSTPVQSFSPLHSNRTSLPALCRKRGKRPHVKEDT